MLPEGVWPSANIGKYWPRLPLDKASLQFTNFQSQLNLSCVFTQNSFVWNLKLGVYMLAHEQLQMCSWAHLCICWRHIRKESFEAGAHLREQTFVLGQRSWAGACKFQRHIAHSKLHIPIYMYMARGPGRGHGSLPDVELSWDEHAVSAKYAKFAKCAKIAIHVTSETRNSVQRWEQLYTLCLRQSSLLIFVEIRLTYPAYPGIDRYSRPPVFNGHQMRVIS